MKEKTEYLIAALDFYLLEGLPEMVALQRAVRDYKFVYHTDDGRPRISRAAEAVLDYIEEKPK